MAAIKPGGYTVAKIQRMNNNQLMAAVKAFTAEYKQNPSSELGKLIGFMINTIEDRNARHKH